MAEYPFVYRLSSPQGEEHMGGIKFDGKSDTLAKVQGSYNVSGVSSMAFATGTVFQNMADYSNGMKKSE